MFGKLFIIGKPIFICIGTSNNIILKYINKIIKDTIN